MVVALNPLHKKYKIKRIVVSTYQSVSGTGVKAVNQLLNERKSGSSLEMAYKYKIDLNAIPQIDIFMENGYTKEEMKMVNETKKIMNDSSIRVTATAVRVPVMGGHSESVNIEFEESIELNDIRETLAKSEGVVIWDNPQRQIYPMPLDSRNKDQVFVGRIRRDESQKNSINLWIVADNLRKGAALNTIQISEIIVKQIFKTTFLEW